MIKQSRKISIETTCHYPANYRGTRYTATTCNGQRLTLSADDRLNHEENHAAAAQALADKMKWTGNLLQGATKRGYVFVFLP